jgi:CheY-like chemotaxis protein
MIALAVEPLRVLLVEDNLADARLVREMLRDEDCDDTTITHTERLSDALAALRTGGFNVVLLDLTLPDSTGIETFERAHREARTAPIVVLTGLADRAVATRAVRDGAQDYLVKGQVDGRALHQSLRHAVARQAADLALRASEERFRQLVENITEAFVVVDLPSLKVQYVSRVWEDLWGRPLQEAYAGPSSWIDGVHQADRALAQAAIRQVAAGQPASAMFRVTSARPQSGVGARAGVPHLHRRQRPPVCGADGRHHRRTTQGSPVVAVSTYGSRWTTRRRRRARLQQSAHRDPRIGTTARGGSGHRPRCPATGR